MNETINAVKRFIVVLYTEALFFVTGAGLLYILYVKCNSISDITTFLNNPINPISLCILGIGSLGGGYIGCKLWENLQSSKEPSKGDTNDNKQN